MIQNKMFNVTLSHLLIRTAHKIMSLGVISWLLCAPLMAQNWPEALLAKDPAGVAFERFGQSVAIDGNYAIVGAWGENEDATGNNYAGGAGAAYIYERVNGTWSQVQKIVASDRAANDYFGYSVAISGDYVIVGAYNEAHDASGGNSKFGAGSAYIFHQSGGVWTQMQKIVASDRGNFDYFGDKVAISGTVAVVGAYVEDHDASGGNGKTNAGSAYVFELVTGTWTQVNKIVAADRLAYDSFGGSVSISGDYIVVGAGTEDEDANDLNTINNSGSVYIFKKVTGNWTQVQKIVAPNRSDSDFFGTVVSISGNYLVVGSYYEDEDAAETNTVSDAGSAYIFELSGATWTFFQKIVPSERATNDHFGSAVAIADDKIIIGANNEDEDAVGGSTLNNAGSAYIFQLISGSWSEVEKITASDRGANAKYGSTVAIFDSTALVGASEANSYIGEAYFYGYDTRLPHGGYALELDGTDDCVSLGQLLAPGSNYSIEAWIYTNTTSGSANIVSSNNSFFWLNGHTFSAGLGGFSSLAQSSNFPVNEWVHVAVTFDDASNTMTLYKNGIVVYTNTGVIWSMVAEPMYIGAQTGTGPTYAPNNFFDGTIDEVRIWSDVRTQAEIQASMNKELAGNEAYLVSYYSMTDATGTSLTDNSGNSHTGTLTNGPAWKASGALAGPRQALNFDGVDDYVSVPHDPTLNLGADDFTIEWWVKRSVTASRMDILNKKADDGSSDLGIFLTDQDKIMFFVEQSAVAQTVVSLTSIGTEWTHIAGVRSGNNLSVYINGNLDNTSTASPRNVNNTSHLIFGGNNQGGSVSVNFTGTLDEMRIWTSARTQAQIRAQMYHTLRGDETGLAAYFRFDQIADAGNLTAYDLTANANHGNLTNMDGTSDWVASDPFNTWVGSEDSDWSNAANWSLGTVPSTEDVAIYP